MREIAVLQCAFATGQSDCHDGICPSPLSPPDNEAISQLFPDLRQCLGTAGRLEGHHQYTARGHCGRLVVRSGGNDQRPTALRRRRGRHLRHSPRPHRSPRNPVVDQDRVACCGEHRRTSVHRLRHRGRVHPRASGRLRPVAVGRRCGEPDFDRCVQLARVGLDRIASAPDGGLRHLRPPLALRNWSEVPGIVGYRLRVFLRGYLEFLSGPVTFPIREWRIRREAGSGTAVKLVPAAYTTVLGLSCCSRRCRSASLLPTVFSRVFASSTSGPPTHDFGRAGPAH